ncbi:MAG: hypothetical protein ACOY4I_07385 [Bacillota bacterium]
MKYKTNLQEAIIQPNNLPLPNRGERFDNYARRHRGSKYCLNLKYEWYQMEGVELPELRRIGIVTDEPIKLPSGLHYELPLSLHEMRLILPEHKGKMASFKKLARTNFHDLYDIPAFMLLTVIESMEKYNINFGAPRHKCREYYKNLHTLLLQYFNCYGCWHPSTKNVTLPGYLDIHLTKMDSSIIELQCFRLKQIILMQSYYWLNSFAVSYFFQEEGIPWDNELNSEIILQIKEWYDIDHRGYSLNKLILIPRRKFVLL